MASSREYIFQKINDNAYIRKCFGMEVLTSNMQEYCDGFAHLTISAAISIASSPSRELLKVHVRDAWIAFRHLVPAIACRSFRYPAPDSSFAFRYAVPQSPDEIQAWPEETVFFSDDIRSLYEKHCELKDGHWWRASDDRYVAELHISPLQDENGWQFSMSSVHNSTDGRNAFVMMDLFPEHLTSVIVNKAAPVSAIEWGTEVARLPPPGPFTMAMAKTRSPPDLSFQPPPIVPSTPTTAWLYPPYKTGGRGDVARVVRLSRETTSRLHAVAREKGRTITHVVTALSTLAHTEASLKTARTLGEDRYKEVLQAYLSSSHYLIAWNFMNQRHKYPGGYDSYKSPTSAPLSTFDGTALLLSMDSIRRLVNLDDASNSTYREVDGAVFWDGLVQEVANAWEAIDQSLDGYFAREVASHAAHRQFDPAMFYIPALIVSSVGDFGRLGIFTSYDPQTAGVHVHRQAQGWQRALTVEDVVCGIRIRTPLTMNLLYEYAGRLSCHFFTGGEFATRKALELVTDIFEERTNALVADYRHT